MACPVLRSPVWRISSLVVLSFCFGVGCTPTPPPEPVERPRESSETRPIRVLVVDDVRLGQALERQWLARSEQPIQVLNATSAELIAAPSPPTADVILYPSGLLGTLAERGQIEPLSESVAGMSDGERDDLFDFVRLHETNWGAQPYAVPLGAPQLVLWYRRDMLEKLGATPPTTWSEYQQLAERLADGVPKTAGWSAVAEPWGRGWGGITLLARATSMAWNPNQLSTLFDRRTMQPLIDGPAFQRALDELAATARLTPKAFQQFSPAQARQAFLAGTCALALTWPSAIPPTELATQVAPDDSVDGHRGAHRQVGRAFGAGHSHEPTGGTTTVVAATMPRESLPGLQQPEQRDTLDQVAWLVGPPIAVGSLGSPVSKRLLVSRPAYERWARKATLFLESERRTDLESSLFQLQSLQVTAAHSATRPSSIRHADKAWQGEWREATFVRYQTKSSDEEPVTSHGERAVLGVRVAEPDAVVMRQVGFSALPGSVDFYDTRSQAWQPRPSDQPRQVALLSVAGRLGSLTRWGKRSAAAQTLVAWLATLEAGSELGPASGATTLFRHSQVATASRWVDQGLPSSAAQEYAELVANTHRGGAWLAAPRIPGRHRYLAALDQAVQKVISGQATSQEALSEAAQTWDAITTELGREAQRDAYSRSLGLETSPPE
jgi:ABC-type glycerol-3-phosphate transport system substrate-binding protein